MKKTLFYIFGEMISRFFYKFHFTYKCIFTLADFQYQFERQTPIFFYFNSAYFGSTSYYTRLDPSNEWPMAIQIFFCLLTVVNSYYFFFIAFGRSFIS